MEEEKKQAQETTLDVLETEEQDSSNGLAIMIHKEDNLKPLNLARFIWSQALKACLLVLLILIIAALRTFVRNTDEDDAAAEDMILFLEILDDLLALWFVASVYIEYKELFHDVRIEPDKKLNVPCACWNCFIPMNLLSCLGCRLERLRGMFKCWWYFLSCQMCACGLKNPITNPDLYQNSDTHLNEILYC